MENEHAMNSGRWPSRHLFPAFISLWKNAFMLLDPAIFFNIDKAVKATTPASGMRRTLTFCKSQNHNSLVKIDLSHHLQMPDDYITS